MDWFNQRPKSREGSKTDSETIYVGSSTYLKCWCQIEKLGQCTLLFLRSQCIQLLLRKTDLFFATRRYQNSQFTFKQDSKRIQNRSRDFSSFLNQVQTCLKDHAIKQNYAIIFWTFLRYDAIKMNYCITISNSFEHV